MPLNDVDIVEYGPGVNILTNSYRTTISHSKEGRFTIICSNSFELSSINISSRLMVPWRAYFPEKNSCWWPASSWHFGTGNRFSHLSLQDLLTGPMLKPCFVAKFLDDEVQCWSVLLFFSGQYRGTYSGCREHFEDLQQDLAVIGQIVGLVATLRRSYRVRSIHSIFQSSIFWLSQLSTSSRPFVQVNVDPRIWQHYLSSIVQMWFIRFDWLKSTMLEEWLVSKRIKFQKSKTFHLVFNI